ncbi:MAG: hypothetical protein M1814_001067 [Vezdaea aestivalis]|nr:MAG: hypothetical protein M1814_001067 [Vezdaea aestivalis]
MSGLEVAASIAGLISVSVVLLDGCIKAFDLIDCAQHLEHDGNRLQTKLKWEQFRLFQWSERIGIKGAGRPNPGANWALVTDTLHQLESLLTDAKKLHDSYGLSMQEISDSSTLELQVSETSIGRMLSRLKPDFCSASARAISAQPSPLKKLKWAARDQDKAKSLIAEIKDFNDCLDGFLERAERDFIKYGLAALLRDLVTHTPDTSDLETIRQLARPAEVVNYEALSVAMRLKQVRLTVGLDKRPEETSGTKSIAPIELKVVRLRSKHMRYDPTTHSGVNRELGFYRSRRVLIEWKRTSNTPQAHLHSRIEGLALLLGHVKHPSFHTLHCLGFLQDDVTKQYAFVFQLDNNPTAGLREVPMMARELNDLFAESRRPSLTERIHIASTLSETVLQLHTTGWLHKGISSRNVLFLEEGHLNWIRCSAKGPYLAGYEYARADSPTEITETTSSGSELEVYHHPDLSAYPRPAFRKQFDIYALGCVLIEVVLWTKLQTLVSEKDSVDSERVATSRPPIDADFASPMFQRIAFTAGNTIRDVIILCLTAGDFSDINDSNGQSAIHIQKTIVDKLKSCHV